jgi:hypothetical protein
VSLLCIVIVKEHVFKQALEKGLQCEHLYIVGTGYSKGRELICGGGREGGRERHTN